MTFSSVSGGQPVLEHPAPRVARRRPRPDREVEPARPISETAIDGMPSSVPSMAADTVPEYVTSSPRLAPLLIPETTSVGLRGRMPLIARLTQSVGVPSTA